MTERWLLEKDQLKGDHNEGGKKEIKERLGLGTEKKKGGKKRRCEKDQRSDTIKNRYEAEKDMRWRRNVSNGEK